MDVLAALAPPLVVAVAFVAIARAAIRYTDGQRSPGDGDDLDESPPEDT